MNVILFIISFLILFNVFYNAILDINKLANFDTLKNILLPPVLTILLIPFIYFVSIYANYEILFVRLKIILKNDRTLLKYLKKRILGHCKINLYKLLKFIECNMIKLANITTKKDVDNIFIKNK
jgi:hypothetical protein